MNDRQRRLAPLRPYGMTRTCVLHELMPRLASEGMSEADKGDYEAALDHFVEGRWSQAQLWVVL